MKIKLYNGMIFKDNDNWLWEVMYDNEKGKFLFYTLPPFPMLDGYEDEVKWVEWELIDDERKEKIERIYKEFDNSDMTFDELYEKLEVLK